LIDRASTLYTYLSESQANYICYVYHTIKEITVNKKLWQSIVFHWSMKTGYKALNNMPACILINFEFTSEICSPGFFKLKIISVID